jgi:hypothetical protein
MASFSARDGSPSRGRSTSPRPRMADENLEASLMDNLPDVIMPPLRRHNNTRDADARHSPANCKLLAAKSPPRRGV